MIFNNNFGYLTISTFTEAGQEDIKILISFAEIDTGNVAAKLDDDDYQFKQ